MDGDPQYRIRLWMQQELDKRGRGIKGQLATALGVRADAITRMLNTDPNKETREISAHELQKMEYFFKSEAPGRETLPRLVPIKGLAGAGPEGSVLFAEQSDELGYIQAPEDDESVAALEVRGDSMSGFAEDGWIIFYEDPMPWHESLTGHLCVCFLADGRVLIKFPYPAKHRGLFDLRSANAPWMRDVPVDRFAYVTEIKTRRAAQRFARRNPDTEIPELRIRGGR